MTTACLGIDVQCSRGCPYVVVTDDLRPQESGWLRLPTELPPIVARLREHFTRVGVGIDAPRRPLPSPREHYWKGHAWRSRRPTDRGHGRHCEVIIKALGLANPQWTPTMGSFPDWMQVGFQLFGSLSGQADIYEVFPSAAYAQLAESADALVSISLKGFVHGPKDMLDAYVAAYTVQQYLAGRGAAVGDGDGLGAIILPRPVDAQPTALFTWPRGEEPPPQNV